MNGRVRRLRRVRSTGRTAVPPAVAGWSAFPVPSPLGSIRERRTPPLALPVSRDPTGRLHPATPAWSPDGLHIAFIDLVDGKQDLFIMDADGTNVRRLTNDAALDMHPAWR